MGEVGRVKKSVQYLIVGEVVVLATLAVILAFVVFPSAFSSTARVDPFAFPTDDQLNKMSPDELRQLAKSLNDSQQRFADIVNSTDARFKWMYVIAFGCWIAVLGGGIAYGMMSEKEIWEQKAGNT